MVEQVAARVLPSGAERFGWSRRNPTPAFDARRPHADRLGHGDRDLSGEPQRGIGDRAHPARRHRDGRVRHAGSRHRHLHGDDAGRRRRARLRRPRTCASSSAIRRCRRRRCRAARSRSASVSPAVQAAASEARDKLIALALADSGSPLRGRVARRRHGRRRLGDQPLDDRRSAIRRRRSSRATAASRSRRRRPSSPATRRQQYSMHSFGAVFAEVARRCATSARSACRASSASTTSAAAQREDGAQPVAGRHRVGRGHRRCSKRAMLDARYGRYHQRQSRRIPRAGECRHRHARHHVRRRGRSVYQSARRARASARSASPACRRRLRTPSITRPASACAICRSRSTSCCRGRPSRCCCCAACTV